jgi:hypothetical protein
MREQRTAHAAATQQTASDEEAQQPAVSALAFVVFVFVVVLVLAFVLAALAKKMGEECATDATATQHPAGDQKAQDPAMILVCALVLIIVFALVSALVLVLVLLLAVLAQEVCKEQAADAATAQQAACNQELQDAMLLIASLLTLSAKFVAFLSATALT